ncbi:MAG TPA: hypothetical protein VHE37_02185 [Nevskiaceae bacterium]|nr:hypothetical protein [Nevskiaceae bacterium]
MSKGSRILVAAWGALYLAALAWYGGHGAPMTAQEKDALFALIQQRAEHEPLKDGHLLEELHRLADSDDGDEFYMLNLIRYREHAAYPPGYDYDGDVLAADARYNRAIAPYLFRHGGVPVFLGTPEGRFIDGEGDETWQRVAIVRYRSRRDLLAMVADLAGQDVAVHKWASIEKTQVFPVRAMFSLVMVRLLLATVFVALGLLLHLLLRNAAWYRGRSPA